MEQQNVERRLAAILVGDVAGYSRLMGSDEEGTLAQLKAHQSALVDPKIRECHGKIIKTTGDGMLVTFPSAVEAVRCAVEVQRGMAERNADVPPEERIEFRLGINVGDVIHDNKDIFGEGVNIAARLETLAEPGGICVSQAVRDPVRHNRGFTFEDMGEQTLKNISAPIHAYRVRLENVEPTAHATSVTWLRHRRKIVVFGLASGFAVATIVVGVWQSRPPRVPSQAASAQPSAPLPLPDKPSIAVLPFTNIGGDAKQERLTDGITEDVITDLSHYHGLFVIARNSVMTYKGKAVNVQQVGRELGVRYVLEGSIQTSGDHIRVTAQLIDAKTGGHVWSDRYDRSLDDIFEVQSEVTQKIAATLGGVTGTLAAADASSIRRKPPASLQAYDYYVLGQEHHYRTTKEDSVKAEELLTKAIGLDPQFARAYFALGHLYNTEAYWGWGNEEPTALFEKAKVALLKAIALDPSDAIAHAVLGEVYLSMSDYDHGFAELEQAFALNPNDPDVLLHYGMGLPSIGKAQEGVEMINRAFRLNPHYPPWYNTVDAFYAAGQYDEVITRVRRMGGDVSIWRQLLLAMSYGQLGRQVDAATAAAELLRRYPEFSMERAFSDFGAIRDQPTLARYLDGARKAGLPECATQGELQKFPKMTHLALCDTRRATD